MRHLVRGFLLFVACLAGSAFAAPAAYDQTTFDHLLKEGKPILVEIQADWCPTCRAQAPVVADLLKTPRLKDITALRVDFDQQKDVVRAFKATLQSTLIVFRNGKEVGRSTGDTRKDSIAALLDKAI
jgi:thioredoxin 1